MPYKDPEARRVHARKYSATHREKLRAYYAEYRRINGRPPDDPATARAYLLSKKYGLTTAQYGEMLEAQGGVCALCGKAQTIVRFGRTVRLAVDHDHETGQIRQLLCHHCNAGLGAFQDDPNLLAKAIAYLERHRGNL